MERSNQEIMHPERVLQFGEGNFLRGFVDWMLHRMNEKGLFQGQAVVVQPIEHGLTDLLNERGGKYTMLLRGIQQGKLVDEGELITSIRRGINPYQDYQAYIACAGNPDLRFIVSNTTEAGIVYDMDNQYTDAPPSTFPGKLTVLLHKRFEAFGGDPSKGLVIVPCELIDRNGDKLKEIVLRYGQQWQLGDAFTKWLEHCYFLNTLVDRIVTGYPKEEMEPLTERFGYADPLMNTAEPFHLWVIEGDRKLAEELPLVEAGLNVIWTDDMTPYRTRKVRILNGAHTMTVLAAYLTGLNTVKECMDDELVSAFMKKGLFEEIIPTLDLPEEELASYASSVLERFANPYIKHYLLSIALNSVSKFKTRVLPSLLSYAQRKQELPEALCFSLAALLVFYRGSTMEGGYLGSRFGEPYSIQDDAPHMAAFEQLWSEVDETEASVERFVQRALAQESFWGEDLTQVQGLKEAVKEAVAAILQVGMKQAMEQLMQRGR
jgi:tagaturonate reductase